MAASTKTEKYGSYICKVGYLDIRKKLSYIKIPGERGGYKMKVDSHEYLIYHGTHLMLDGFKSDKRDAMAKAKEMVENKVMYLR